jgi:hypothetical protein
LGSVNIQSSTEIVDEAGGGFVDNFTVLTPMPDTVSLASWKRFGVDGAAFASVALHSQN